MSAPRVRIFVTRLRQTWELPFFWFCTNDRCKRECSMFVEADSIAAAADAGRAHLAAHHTAQMPPTKDATVSAALDQFEAEHPEPVYDAPGPHAALSWANCDQIPCTCERHNIMQRLFEASRSDS